MHVWGPVSVRRLSKRRKQSAVEEDPAVFLWLYVYRCTRAWADTWTHTHTRGDTQQTKSVPGSTCTWEMKTSESEAPSYLAVQWVGDRPWIHETLPIQNRVGHFTGSH